MTDPLNTAATQRTRVRRVPERGRYDGETIGAILDEALVCHVGVVSDGSPIVIPMACARDDDRLLLHGSTASRLLKTLRATTILSVPLTEASAKVRSGPPVDDEEDLSLDIWAGEVPLRTVSLEPVPDPLIGSEKPVPASVARFRKERVPPEPQA